MARHRHQVTYETPLGKTESTEVVVDRAQLTTVDRENLADQLNTRQVTTEHVGTTR